MKPIWKQIYPWIKTAVQNLDSLDSLLHQTVEQISEFYGAECLLWIDLENSATARVYGRSRAMQQGLMQQGLMQQGFNGQLDSSEPSSHPEDSLRRSPLEVQMRQLQQLPDWIREQQRSPHMTQLANGDLIVPIAHRTEAGNTDGSKNSGSNTLQFVLQLSRPDSRPSPMFTDRHQPERHPKDRPDWTYDSYDLRSGDDPFAMSDYIDPFVPSSPRAVSSLRRMGVEFEQMPFRGWKADELESLEIVGSQLGLAYSALYWRQRLEQSRQQAGLIGRITRLINSSLSAMEIVGQIVAELGYGIQCDRSLLINLQQEPIQFLAQWDHPERLLLPLSPTSADRESWQNITSVFLESGASHLELSLNQPAPAALQTWLRQMGAKSVLFVPLSIQSDFFGAIALLSYDKARSYLLDELQTVRQAADQAAIALTNAQNFEQFRDRQEALQQEYQALRMEVMRDELTQLLNRRALERELERLDSMSLGNRLDSRLDNRLDNRLENHSNSDQENQTSLCVLICDVDYFKRINDTYGHLVGDEVLSSLAQRLQHQSRRETPVYRYGGEEFVVLLSDTTAAHTLEVAERLRQVIRLHPIKTKAGLIEVTMSFGVAQQQKGDRSGWDVLQRADQALYESKRNGRDRVEAL